jgi:hypothetical protein
MRIGVREWAETVVIFLAGRIPEGELNVFAIDFDVGDVVLEDGGDVDLLRRACQRVCAAVGMRGRGVCCCCCDGRAGRLG